MRRPSERASHPPSFGAVASISALHVRTICAAWLPDGREVGGQLFARDPNHPAQRFASLRIDLRSGRWRNHDSGEGGADLVSLARHIFGIDADAAVRMVCELLGVREGRQ